MAARLRAPSSPAMNESQPPGLTLSRESFARFCDYITGELGIKMSPAKLPLLQSRLHRRLRELQVPSLEAYLDYLFETPAGPEERIHFIDAITTHKTDFFREARHFEYIGRTALRELDRGNGQPSAWAVRVWCAGCSSGEEAYTLAIVLAEFGEQRTAFDFSILATDISTRELSHGARGVYSRERVEPVPPALRSKYLMRSRDPAAGEVRIVPELRRRIEFSRVNFMDDSYAVSGPFDAIFFRNVMIYFSKETQERVLNKLCRHLRPGGFLFVGHSESLAGLDVPVQSVGTSIYRKVV